MAISELPDIITSLDSCTSDTERFSILFRITKCLKGEELSSEERIQLMKSIGYSFLARLLRSQSSPDAEIRLLYRSISLSILSSFRDEVIILTNPSFLFNVPILLDIISDSEKEIYEENLAMIRDAYDILFSLSKLEKGQKAILDHRGLHVLSQIVIQTQFGVEKASKIIFHLLLQNTDCKLWSYPLGESDYNNLMTKLSEDFSVLHENEDEEEFKFELISLISKLLRSYSKDSKSPSWMPSLHQGLQNIIFSKLNKKYRDAALELAASVSEVIGLQWAFASGERFFLILIHLTSIEIVMNLQEKSLEDAIQESSLLSSCFHLLETSLEYFVSDLANLTNLSADWKSSFISAQKNAFSAIIGFIEEHQNEVLSSEQVTFLRALIRVLSAWLSEESDIRRVSNILLFICHQGIQSFEETEKEFNYESLTSKEFQNLPDLLYFLLPGLIQAVQENFVVDILQDIPFSTVLTRYLNHHWTILQHYISWTTQEENSKTSNYNILNPKTRQILSEMETSKIALLNICHFLSYSFLSYKASEKTAFENECLLSQISNILKAFSNDLEENSLVIATLISLALQIIALNNVLDFENWKSFSPFLLFENVVKFLWSFNPMDEENEKKWNDVFEPWNTSMNFLIIILTSKSLHWLSSFIADSGWPVDICRSASTALKIPESSITKIYDTFLKTLLEEFGHDFLCKEDEEDNNLSLEDLKALCIKCSFNNVLSLL